MREPYFILWVWGDCEELMKTINCSKCTTQEGVFDSEKTRNGWGKSVREIFSTILSTFCESKTSLKNNILTDNNKNRIHPIILLSELSGRSSWLTLLPTVPNSGSTLVNIIWSDDPCYILILSSPTSSSPVLFLTHSHSDPWQWRTLSLPVTLPLPKPATVKSLLFKAWLYFQLDSWITTVNYTS